MSFLDDVSDFVDRASDAVDRVKKVKKEYDKANSAIRKLKAKDYTAVLDLAEQATGPLSKKVQKKIRRAQKLRDKATRVVKTGRSLFSRSPSSSSTAPVLAAHDGNDPFDLWEETKPWWKLPPGHTVPKGGLDRKPAPVPTPTPKTGGSTVNLPAILKTAEKAVNVGTTLYGAYRGVSGRLPAPDVSNPPTGVYVPGHEHEGAYYADKSTGTQVDVRAPGMYVVAIAAGVLQANRAIGKGFKVPVVNMAGEMLGDYHAVKHHPARSLISFNHPQNALGPGYWPGLVPVPQAGVYEEAGQQIVCTLLKKKPKRRRKVLTPKRLARFRQLAGMIERHDKMVKKTKRMCKMR